MKRLETALVAFVICWLVVGAIIQTRHAVAGMMGDLPKAVPAVYYPNSATQTYSIWSEKGMSLFCGLTEICVCTRGGVTGLHFTADGKTKVLNLRPGEAVIISADPKISLQPKVGPRK